MAEQLIGELKSSPVVSRCSTNPVLSAKDIPYPSALIFNAGVTKFHNRYVMTFTNDYGSLKDERIEGTNIGLAYSNDGEKWDVQPEPCFKLETDELTRAYDPRLTMIEDRCYMCFAVHSRHGIRCGIAVTDNFINFEFVSLSVPDNRNIVLFPEKINNMYFRLERPFPVYGRNEVERFDIWISESPDLRYWGNSDLLLGVEDVPFSNLKIGPGAPPIKTEKGWLTTFHAVDLDPSRGKNGWEDIWNKRYTAGIMLLDLENPRKIIGLYDQPLIVPETSYETGGCYRNDVIFPTGMILENTGEVKIYYGAGDTTICLALADVNDLISLCLNGNTL
ncbi:MAG: glycoside hydrolase family 130 protein [Spirochaetales bacterium]|jgi:beta-1,4-mannooligosaccharide/beta-1,4-mannosyl-N-acetylglucosamine phosphorylase|nr:glycoside hydrolase family 130 protein [Spirochaetales bacterium]